MAARAVVGSPFFFKKLIYDFLAENNYPELPHSQGGMKFGTQISPLVIFYFGNTTLYTLNGVSYFLLTSILLVKTDLTKGESQKKISNDQDGPH